AHRHIVQVRQRSGGAEGDGVHEGPALAGAAGAAVAAAAAGAAGAARGLVVGQRAVLEGEGRIDQLDGTALRGTAGPAVGAGAAVAAEGMVVRDLIVAEAPHRADALNADRGASPLAAAAAVDTRPTRAAVAATGLVAGEFAVLDRESGAGCGDEHALVNGKDGAADVGGRGVETGAAVVAADQVVGEGAVRHRGAAAAPDCDAAAGDGPVAGERAAPDGQGRVGVAQDAAARTEQDVGAAGHVVGERAVLDREGRAEHVGDPAAAADVGANGSAVAHGH